MNKKYIWVVIQRIEHNEEGNSAFPVAVFDDINKMYQACRDFNNAGLDGYSWLDVSQMEINNREYLDELIEEWLEDSEVYE